MLRKILSDKKKIWHKHFAPSIFAGILVAIVAFIFDATTSNMILLASVGASASILTNSKSHHLTKLKTTISAYTIIIIYSASIYLMNQNIPLKLELNLFLLVTGTSILLWIFNSFHPPAISASVSFILLETKLSNLILLFIAIILLLTIWRLLVFIFIQKVSLNKTRKELIYFFKKRKN